MINLQQHDDGFMRMDRHFPRSASVSITFTDGTTEVITGARINKAYDDALAVFRERNHLDAKGFTRIEKKRVLDNHKINFVPVHPGMAE
ncbi:hypothetical protein OL239_10775 [Arthrobacter sp. ATA002]|uniref:hypothetical protein n=1 Tax=Arthrobacter sp. ATA002 TaxID=2991715 RepID=UPI0022A71EE5|nr:hypothetical protein [Arthrobacter sp. ATA002]WAP50531.1 hypothetical protein OL239_10775 [Arthrobacter sp. ATA002]